MNDLRLALRLLFKRPGFTAAAVLTLALGIGATTTIVSVVNGVLLRPLPFTEPERLVSLYEANRERGWTRQQVAPANAFDWRARVAAFQDVTLYNEWAGGVLIGGERAEPAFARGTFVFGNFFSVLGVAPEQGRGFTEEESWAGRDMVVVLSHGLWQRQFGGRTDLIDRTILVDGRERVVVGIMPPGFAFPQEETALWMPMGWNPANRDAVWFRRAHFLRGLARLRPGVTLDQAAAQLERVAGQLQDEHPDINRGMEAGLTPLHDWIVAGSRGYLLIVLGAVGLLLLIGCANVANLFLVRVLDRRHELAVRTALGASRARIGRQVAAESLVLAAAGGALGIALAVWGSVLFVRAAGSDVPRLAAIQVDGVVLTIAVLLTGGTALLFGIGPALFGARIPGSDALRERGGGLSLGRRAGALRRGLVAAETAVALLLVTGAGLMLRTVQELRRVNPGFDPDPVFTATLQLPTGQYPTRAEVVAFQQTLLDRLGAAPGVASVGAADALPTRGSTWTSDFAIEGLPPLEHGTELNRRIITPGYFEAMGVPLLRGRGVTETDDADSPRVVVINQILARRFFGERDPIGRRIAFERVPGPDESWYTVVGIVGPEKVERLGGDRDWPEIFVSAAQVVSPQLSYVLRSASARPEVLLGTVADIVRDLDPSLALAETRTMRTIVGESVARERFVAGLLSLFGTMALALAAVGIAGVIGYAVSRRQREIGVRAALGARPDELRWLVIRQGMAPVGIGMAVGLLAALLSAGVLSGLLYQVRPTDPLTLITVTLTLGAVALAACWLPARRAARIDPMEALRHE